MNLPNTRNNTHHTAKAKSPLRLVKTKDLSRDEWLEARRSGLGSSDAATALGLNCSGLIQQDTFLREY